MDGPQLKKGDWVVIKKKWEGAGLYLEVLGPAIFVEQWWVPVLNPAKEDPDFHKVAGLEKL